MDEVVDCSTAALHLMARDPYNRLIMRQLNVIPTFVQVGEHMHVLPTLLSTITFWLVSFQLLYTRHEGIQRAAVGALSELALDPEGADQIEREKASEPLTELLHSTNEAIGESHTHTCTHARTHAHTHARTHTRTRTHTHTHITSLTVSLGL